MSRRKPEKSSEPRSSRLSSFASSLPLFSGVMDTPRERTRRRTASRGSKSGTAASGTPSKALSRLAQLRKIWRNWSTSCCENWSSLISRPMVSSCARSCWLRSIRASCRNSQKRMPGEPSGETPSTPASLAAPRARLSFRSRAACSSRDLGSQSNSLSRSSSSLGSISPLLSRSIFAKSSLKCSISVSPKPAFFRCLATRLARQRSTRPTNASKSGLAEEGPSG
mmetsp:Transcript_41940/g.129991  ORF Transcript_41940/g.129991 Transcript_41940/m.129991 type:complete len:224 (+) Transcript_41940:320-991(+)